MALSAEQDPTIGKQEQREREREGDSPFEIFQPRFINNCFADYVRFGGYVNIVAREQFIRPAHYAGPNTPRQIGGR